jgi:hypothetical protein
MHTGKMDSIDNQQLTSKNTKKTGNKPAKQEMNNKPNMTTKPQHLHIFRKSAAGQPPKTVNYFQDDTNSPHPVNLKIL